jgi:hypothetical protein
VRDFVSSHPQLLWLPAVVPVGLVLAGLVWVLVIDVILSVRGKEAELDEERRYDKGGNGYETFTVDGVAYRVSHIPMRRHGPDGEAHWFVVYDPKNPKRHEGEFSLLKVAFGALLFLVAFVFFFSRFLDTWLHGCGGPCEIWE